MGLFSNALQPKIRMLLTKKAAKLLLLRACSNGIFTYLGDANKHRDENSKIFTTNNTIWWINFCH